MKKNIILIILIVGLTGWQCSRMDSQSDLKQSLQDNVDKINTGIDKISATNGYKLLTLSGNLSKSEESYNDSITLSMVSGIYDFQPDKDPGHNLFFPYKLFKRTGDSEHMIVNLPEKLIFHPRYLHVLNQTDTTLTNNFTIDASDYHLYYNWWNSFDYLMSAGFTLDSAGIGSMTVSYGSSSFKDRNYSSSFSFPDDYSISAEWQTGDTSSSSFDFEKGNDLLLKEVSVFVRTGYRQFEKQYTLSIGNIDVVKSTAIDSIQVFLDGVLQNQAAVKITDSSDTTGSICNKRDILLTFNDGTTAKLSELISPAMDSLRSLINSLHDMYFAQNIVNYIAGSIYYNDH